MTERFLLVCQPCTAFENAGRVGSSEFGSALEQGVNDKRH